MRIKIPLMLLIICAWPYAQGNNLSAQQELANDVRSPSSFDVSRPVITEKTQFQKEAYMHSEVELRGFSGNSALVLLKYFPCISKIHCRNCKQLDLSSLDSILQGMAGGKVKQPKVVEFSFEYCGLHVKDKAQLQWLAHLESLRVYECDITSASVALLAESARRFSKLRCLTVSGTKLDETSLMHWAGVTSIEQLYLGPQGSITPRVVKHILSGLNSLNRCFLGRSPLAAEENASTTEMARELCAALAKKASLVNVDVSQLAGLDDTCVELLCGNRKLVALSLPWVGSYSTTLTPVALEYLLLAKNLSLLSTGTIPITPEWLRSASEKLPLLELSIASLPTSTAMQDISFPYLRSLAMQIGSRNMESQRIFPSCPMLNSLYISAYNGADLLPCIQWATGIQHLTCVRVSAGSIRVRDMEEFARAKVLQEVSIESVGTVDGSLLAALKKCPRLIRLSVSTLGALTVGNWEELRFLGSLKVLVLNGAILSETDQGVTDCKIEYLSIQKAEWLSAKALAIIQKLDRIIALSLEVPRSHMWTMEELQILRSLEQKCTFIVSP